ncbi:MAG: excinuclease ABC subunit UvrC [Chitinispirillia bacterium]|nr:excinuclease ABC subunit UvrC [Chitinispirillia bacterium]MCL2267896.1 excinuclease ABC subunit UvrC [Chitinispirillia bacterium]
MKSGVSGANIYAEGEITPNPRLQTPLYDQVSRFPETPGVYQMKDANGNLLYIGKAVNLRSRVRSYFSDTHGDRMQIPGMMRQLDHIDLIVTHTEAEALILEANLIRKHKPKYNIELRDDKHYPYLKITAQEPFPRLLVVRRVERDGAVYFGPYTDVKVMRRVAGFAKRIFRLRDCAKNLPLQKPIRPCINHSMKRCSGPCAGNISSDDYRSGIDDLTRFLKGRRNDLIRELEERMASASKQLKFEDAALLRDQIKLIRDASRLQRVDLKMDNVDCDVLGIAQGDREISLAILHFRDGLLMAGRNFLFKRDRWEMSSESRDNVIPQFYMGDDTEIPREIIIPGNAGFTQSTLQGWFDDRAQQSQLAGTSAPGRPPSPRTHIIIPQKGTKRLLALMAEKNAHSYLMQKAPPNASNDIEDLQKALNLPKTPEVIEAFDISNIGESFTVAGMVQFKNGLPNKSGYRRYKIKTVEGQNDFAMMMEAVTRRLRRLTDENGQFPDLLLIDGGKGQLRAAMEALARFDNPPMIASLAKKEEILFSPHLPEPLALPPTHPARKLAERIRDEVHRYAVTYHRKIRGKQFTRSELENLPGIGKVKAQLLLKRFGSIKRLKEASAGEIAGVQGFSEESAEKLKKYIDGNPQD